MEGHALGRDFGKLSQQQQHLFTCPHASFDCHFPFHIDVSYTTTEIFRLQKMSEQPQSLRELFSNAERARQELLSSYDSNSPAFQENLLQTIATYEECLKVSKQISLFSPNESLEDISSSDLQYVYDQLPA
jgi:hypothetical protein